MILKLTALLPNPSDLGYLLYKHPSKFQSFSQSIGKAHVFYPECREGRSQVCLVLDVDPSIESKRILSHSSSASQNPYVNNTPYASCSLLAVAIGSVFRTAMTGRSNDRPELANQALDLTAEIAAVVLRGGKEIAERLFQPLGLQVQTEIIESEHRSNFEKGSEYCKLVVAGKVKLSQMLSSLYVLLPVIDQSKHYYVDETEVEKLLLKAYWLNDHPEKKLISQRYLKFQKPLVNSLLSRLEDSNDKDTTGEARAISESLENFSNSEESEPVAADQKPLNQQRYDAVIETLKKHQTTKVLDLGCSDGKFLKQLVQDPDFRSVAGCDVSPLFDRKNRKTTKLP